MNLEQLGFHPPFQQAYEAYRESGLQVGRVALEHKHLYRVWTEAGEVIADCSGKMQYEAVGRKDYPAVGDWVVLQVRASEGRGTIHALLPRKSKFSRKKAGKW